MSPSWCSDLTIPVDIPQEEISKEHILDVVRNYRHVSSKAKSKTAASNLNARERLILDATNYIESKYYFKTLDDTDQITYYDRGVLKPKGEILVKKELQAQFRGKLTTSIVREVLENIRRDTYAINSKNELDSNLKIQNMINGFYNLETDKFVAHGEKPPIIDDKEYLSINQKDITYNPRARPKLFGRFLQQVLYPGEIRTAIEAMAYSFYRDNPIEAYFILVGVGRNGKSVFTRLLTELLGNENVSNVPMSAIMTDLRFAISDMEHKDANVDTELSSATIKDMAIIKRITTRQPFRIERKNQRAYDTRIHAKLWYNTNMIPETNDDSDAHYSREVIISFPNQFLDGKNADPELIAKLATEDELSGIFNVLMIALRRVLKNGSIYQKAKTIEERREKAKRATNPVRAFLTEGLAEDAAVDDRVIKTELYEAYRLYCKYHNLHYEAENVFAGVLKNKCKMQDGRQASGDRKTFWSGIRLAKWLAMELSKAKGRQTMLMA